MAPFIQVTDFYEYFEGMQEGWDGPALLVFSNGHHIGARLDRNGLRPARFWQTADDYVYVASEVRVWLGRVLQQGLARSGAAAGPGHAGCRAGFLFRNCTPLCA